MIQGYNALRAEQSRAEQSRAEQSRAEQVVSYLLSFVVLLKLNICNLTAELKSL